MAEPKSCDCRDAVDSQFGEGFFVLGHAELGELFEQDVGAADQDDKFGHLIHVVIHGSILGVEAFLSDVSYEADGLREYQATKSLLRDSRDGFHMVNVNSHDGNADGGHPLAKDEEQFVLRESVEPRMIRRAVGERMAEINHGGAKGEDGVDRHRDVTKLSDQPWGLGAERFIADFDRLAHRIETDGRKHCC